jgi:hypothetical protein
LIHSFLPQKNTNFRFLIISDTKQIIMKEIKQQQNSSSLFSFLI